MLGTARTARRAALLGCASSLILATATMPSRAEQQIMSFYVNGGSFYDVTGQGNGSGTGCCYSYKGPATNSSYGHSDLPMNSHPAVTFRTNSSPNGAISEASGHGHGTKGHPVAVGAITANDAYDGFGGTGLVGQNNFGGLTVNRNTQVTHGPNEAVVTPIQAPFAQAGVPNAARFVETLTNNTNAPITGVFAYSNNLGSDSNTLYVANSNGQLAPNSPHSATGNLWLTSIQNNSFGDHSTSDPVITTVLGNNAYAKTQVQAVQVNQSNGNIIGPYANGDDNPGYYYPITVAPGQTQRVILFSVLTADVNYGLQAGPDTATVVASDIALGGQIANLITNNGKPIDADSTNFLLFSGLSRDELLTVINFDFVGLTIDASRPYFIQTNYALQQSVPIFDGGTLRPTGPLTFNNPFVVNAAGGTIDNTNGTLVFNGVLSGVGGMTYTGGNKTILTAANTYTGTTTVNSGTLQVDGSIASSNVVVNNGGTLEVDGTVASPNVVVNAGGTLSGVGKIGDPTINAGGTLAPGNTANPYGTLTIVGPLSFAAGSFYNVNINPTQNSRTNVVGTTTIAGGTVNVLAGSGTYATNTRYTILNSTDGVNGRFADTAINSNFAFLRPTLSYDANNVYLAVSRNNAYASAAETRNQLAVAKGLDTAAKANPGGNGGRIITALNQLTAPQARAVFNSLSGEGITATQNLAYRAGELFTSSIFDQTTFYGPGAAGNAITLSAPLPGLFSLAPQAPVRELADLPARHIEPVFVPATRTWRAWANGYGGVENIHGNDSPLGTASQRDTLYGGVLGVDYQLMPNYLVGVAVGGTDGTFQVPGRGTSGSTSGGQVAIYDIATFGAFYGASSSSFAYYGNRTTRNVGGFGGLGGETERGNFNSREFRSRLEFGRHFDGYGMSITPFVALEIADYRSNGFAETSQQGAGLFRLNVSGMSQASVPGYVGLRFQRIAPVAGMAFMPTLQVAYVHEFAPYRQQYAGMADLPGAAFLIDGARPSYNAAQVKVGGELRIRPGAALFANFDGEFSGVNQFYAGKGGFRWTW